MLKSDSTVEEIVKMMAIFLPYEMNSEFYLIKGTKPISYKRYQRWKSIVALNQ
jgi:hypothetical protein